MSSLGNELFGDISDPATQDVIICRASRHILEQHKILSDASAKWKIDTELPSSEIISRELIEYEKARRIIVPSRICKESFIRNGVEPSKVKVVYFPSNLSDFIDRGKIDQKDFVITFVGQVTLRKGICTLLEALGKLKFIDYKVNLVGPIDSKFATYLKGLQFDRNQIIFHGHQNSVKVREILSTTSVFVMPSIEEGWPMAVMEAISMGCIPLVSDAICHLDELPIPDPAFLFQSENSRELASKIENLRQNQEHYQEYIQGSADNLSLNRSWVNFVDDFLESIS
jgi:glycosyltransferase involved in cell wall biosynthesis